MTYEDSVANADEWNTTDTDILAISDTGSSCLVLPSKIYNFIIAWLLQYLTSTDYDSDWGYIFSCDDLSNLPTIDILYGGIWLEILPEDYIVDFEQDNLCGFCIT